MRESVKLSQVKMADFSSHSQTEQSIEGLPKVCNEYAAANNYVVVGEYIDRAQSGTTDNRTEFQRMIADSDRHTFEGVLVYQLDRFARNRYDRDKSLSDIKNLEALGNKALLEKRINIRAADYRFTDKVKYYQGFTNSRNQKKDGTKNHELINLTTKPDFTESDIQNRTKRIMAAFQTFLEENNLTK